MSTFVMGCSRAYRRIARAFPHQYRAICGDGLEQLGEDVVPRVWQQHGVAGLIRLFADLAWRLPCEYFVTWIGGLKEATMTGDLFEGTWRARPSEASRWNVPDQPAPQQAYLRFEATDTEEVGRIEWVPLSRIPELAQQQQILGAGALVPLLYYLVSRDTGGAGRQHEAVEPA